MSEHRWKLWARKAREPGPGCPDTETIRRAVEGDDRPAGPTDPSHASVRAHIGDCARCSLEAGELRDFFGDAPAAAEGAARLEKVRGLLRRTLSELDRPTAFRLPLSARAPGGRIPPPRPVAPWTLWAAGSACVLLLGAAGALMLSGRPETSPRVPSLGAVRGLLRGDGRAHLIAPRGEQPAVPRRFTWDVIGPAPSAWLFRLERVDGSAIWSFETTVPWVEPPGPVLEELHRGSRYTWRVEPVGGAGVTAGASFEIAP